MKNLILLLLLGCSLPSMAQLRNADVYEVTEMDKGEQREVIRIPGFDGYQTLKCDFHIHTVFSDGSVWPDVRVNEAWSEGLDAIAITDHIEYRPKKNVLQGDLNESYKIAKQRADQIGFILIKGIEITRSKPIGHLNALFIQDAVALDVKDPVDAIEEANRQGGFVMWNHPGWPNDTSTVYDVHTRLIKNKKIHGIETFNCLEYYPVSFDWCRDMNLTFMGNSDIHGLISTDYGQQKNARPLTLVFAAERSEKGIKDALFAGRSAALFNGELAGRADLLKKLVQASLVIEQVTPKIVEITNQSDISYRFTFKGRLLLLPANKTIRASLPSSGKLTVENCWVGSNKKLEIELPLK